MDSMALLNTKLIAFSGDYFTRMLKTLFDRKTSLVSESTIKICEKLNCPVIRGYKETEHDNVFPGAMHLTGTTVS